MAQHRSYPIAFKRQIAQDFLSGKVSLHGLAKRNDICRNLIRVWVEKYERGEFDDDAEAANLLAQYQARIAALERMVGRLALENELLKMTSQAFRPQKDARPSMITGPLVSPSPRGVALWRWRAARSTT
jgi:transposase-like protein